MTNTLNTPIEVMEHYYPLIFESYHLREGTGGSGTWGGGGGSERAVRGNAVVEGSVLGGGAEGRAWGVRGGVPGRPSGYLVKRGGGRAEGPRGKGSNNP